MRGKSFSYHLNVCSKIITFLSVFLLVSGCSHNPKSVIVEDLRSPPRVTKGVHIVKKGDSLYSIAWHYDWDFKKLAAANAIGSPYTIYPEQRISLNASSVRKSASTTKWPSKKHSLRHKQAIKNHTVKKPTITTSIAEKSGWQWPASGIIIEPFSLTGQVNKGIDIRAKLGDSVKAAAAGEVVYAGNDLGGYGKLIIIKHNSSYLSAYAHNRDLYVREGDSVKASQKIAEIGSTGTTEPKLHFEIRRNGKPVDPMGYLPKR